MFDEAFYAVAATTLPILLLGSIFSFAAQHMRIRSRSDLVFVRGILWAYSVFGLAGTLSFIHCLLMLTGRADLPAWLDQVVLLSMVMLFAINLAVASRPLHVALKRLKIEGLEDEAG